MSVLAEPRLTAAEWAAVMIDPLRDQGYRLTKAGSSASEFLAFKRMSGLAERTLDQYERDVARMFILFPGKGLEEFTSEDMLLVLDQFPTKSQRRARAALSEFWKWAYIWRKVTENPMLRVPSIRETPQRLVDIFTDEEEERLFLLPELRDRVLMMILLGAGLRKSEARNLRLCDVDLAARRIAIYQGKGSKDRLVPVGPKVVEAIAELAVLDGLRDVDHLWYGSRTNQTVEWQTRRDPVAQSTFSRWWKRCLTEAHVPYRNPHTTRHTYATKYLRAGGRLERLSRILGHSSVAITEKIYAHLAVTDLEEDLALVLAVRERT